MLRGVASQDINSILPVSVANGGTGAATARGAAANLGTWYVLASSAIAASVTGTLTETTLATVTLPAGAMGANGAIRVTSVWATPGGSANAKTVRTRLGGISGAQVMAIGVTTSLSVSESTRLIQNRNSASSQVTRNSGSPGSGGSSAAPTTSAINTAVAADLVFTGQLANTGETITLESYMVEVYFAA